MASAKVGQLYVDLEARTAKFESNIKRSNDLLRRMQRETRSTGQAFESLALKVAAVAGFEALRRLGTQALLTGDQIAKASDRVGLSTDTYQALQFAATEASVPLDLLEKGLTRFSVGVGEAARTGKGEFAPVLQEMGIGLIDASGRLKSTETILREFADGLQQSRGGMEQVSRAAEAFGTRGASLVQFLRDGSVGLDDYTKRARELGVVLDSETVRALEHAQTALDVFQFRLSRFSTLAIGGELTKLFPNAETELRRVEEQIESTIERIQRNVDNLEFAALHPPDEGSFAKFFGVADAALSGFRLQVKGGELALAELVTRQVELTAELQSAALAAERAAEAEAKYRAAVVARQDAAAKQKGDLADQVESFRFLRRLEDDAERDRRAREQDEARLFVDELRDRERLQRRLFDDLRSQALTTAETAETAFESAFNSMGDAVARFVTTGKLEFREFAASVLSDLARIATRQALLNLFSSVVGAIGRGKTAKTIEVARGAAFADGRVLPFARGGVVTRPTLFAMAGGAGLMGEAGPEAVLPLKRSSSGQLGVEVTGASGRFSPVVNITYNNNAGSTPEQDRSRAREIEEATVRAMRRMWRTMAKDEQRSGGVLNPVR